MSKFYIKGEQTMDEMNYIDHEAVKGGKGSIPKICPMKFSTLANPNIDEAIDLHTVDLFTACHKELCAWYCTYPNGKGECVIHSLPGLFDGLDSIATQIATK